MATIVYDQGAIWDSPLLEYCMIPPLLAVPVCGPNVELADADDALQLVEMDHAPALLYQRDGSIWLQALAVRDAAATTKSRSLADAIARTGGSPGKTIKVVVLRPIKHPEANGEGGTDDEQTGLFSPS